MSQFSNAYHKMARLSAVCLLDSYPFIFIRENEHDNQDLIKHIDFQKRPLELRPNLFKMYELDAELPTDSKMIVHNKKQRKFLIILLIVCKLILKIEKQRIAYNAFKERFKTEKETLKYDQCQNAQKSKFQLSGQFQDLQQRIENFDKMFKVLLSIRI